MPTLPSIPSFTVGALIFVRPSKGCCAVLEKQIGGCMPALESSLIILEVSSVPWEIQLHAHLEGRGLITMVVCRMEVTPAWRKGTVKYPIQSPRYKGHVVSGVKEMGRYVAY
uniref:Uncharacterized protein n=1 Tax=Micrurus lemniscatus lemniscatus TaxID=129467 RepID=A0A2D4J4R1_MICLE